MLFLNNRFSLKKNGFVVAQFCGVIAQMRRALLRSYMRKPTMSFKIS